MSKTTEKRVEIRRPKDMAGLKGFLDGDRFKYPGQSFWVQPVKLDTGEQVLCTEYTEVDDLPPLKVNPEPSLVYNYQDCLTRGVCIHCGKTLEWKLEVKKDDDRFCAAICCATKFSMVPEKVRILASFAYPLTEEELKEDDEMCDDDFLKELQKAVQ